MEDSSSSSLDESIPAAYENTAALEQRSSRGSFTDPSSKLLEAGEESKHNLNCGILK